MPSEMSRCGVSTTPSVNSSSASPRLRVPVTTVNSASAISPSTGPSASWTAQRPEPASSCTPGRVAGRPELEAAGLGGRG